MRSKFVITLQGITRVLQTLQNSEVKEVQSEEDLDLIVNLIDILSVCLLDGEENCVLFYRLQGYEYVIQVLLMSKYLRKEALKLLSSILAVCPTDHVVHMIQQSKVLAVFFGVFMRSDEHKAVKNANLSIKAQSKQELATYYEHLLSVVWQMI